MIALVLLLSPTNWQPPTVHHVDVIESNRFGIGTGHFDQYIYWRFGNWLIREKAGDDHREWTTVCVAWTQSDSKPTRHRGVWVQWVRRERWTRPVVVSARIYRRTHTDHDPEIDDRKRFPVCRRPVFWER